MYKVLGKLLVGKIYCISIEGDTTALKNGLKLVDEKGNKFEIKTVGMTHYRKVEDCMRYADIV